MQALLKISQNGKSEYNINKFMTGNAQDAYKYMGSHEAVVDGISGMIFGIWAPDARRVSVIGLSTSGTDECSRWKRIMIQGYFSCLYQI